MASRGAAAARLAAMAAASGLGLLGLAQGLGALAASLRTGSPSVLAAMPITWSKFLADKVPVPSLLLPFKPREVRYS